MSRTVFTDEDYAGLPDDGHRYEVHDGELSVTPSPGTWHQRVKANLFDILRHHVLARRAGELFDAPLDCILSQTTIVQPTSSSWLVNTLAGSARVASKARPPWR
jgi:Uma2 family endonuclease